jgi:hypothetical protein
MAGEHHYVHELVSDHAARRVQFMSSAAPVFACSDGLEATSPVLQLQQHFRASSIISTRSVRLRLMHRTHATSFSKRACIAAPHNLMRGTRQREKGASPPSSNHACVRSFAACFCTCSSRTLSSACNTHRMGTADLSSTPG